MFNFVIQLGQIVTEKELGLRDYMQLMGLKVKYFQKLTDLISPPYFGSLGG